MNKMRRQWKGTCFMLVLSMCLVFLGPVKNTYSDSIDDLIAEITAMIAALQQRLAELIVVKQTDDPVEPEPTEPVEPEAPPTDPVLQAWNDNLRDAGYVSIPGFANMMTLHIFYPSRDKGATVSPEQAEYPLIIYFHNSTVPLGYKTCLFEPLAKAGYIVCSTELRSNPLVEQWNGVAANLANINENPASILFHRIDFDTVGLIGGPPDGAIAGALLSGANHHTLPEKSFLDAGIDATVLIGGDFACDIDFPPPPTHYHSVLNTHQIRVPVMLVFNDGTVPNGVQTERDYNQPFEYQYSVGVECHPLYTWFWWSRIQTGVTYTTKNASAWHIGDAYIYRDLVVPKFHLEANGLVDLISPPEDPRVRAICAYIMAFFDVFLRDQYDALSETGTLRARSSDLRVYNYELYGFPENITW